MTISRLTCAQRDADDALRHTRERFRLPTGVIYLDGNSLGALPRDTAANLASVVDQQWGTDLIGSWNRHGWVNLAQRVGAKIAPLIGANGDEVIVADSTSINLFKVLAGVLSLPEIVNDHSRRIILSERGNFPSDLYIAAGLNELLGRRYELKWVEDGALTANFTSQVAVALVTQVNYRTGYLYSMAAINAAAKAVGAKVIWDLSHSAGALPVSLNADGTEFAIGCGYKYLNGGPGAPAYLYVARARQTQMRTPLAGWFGHAKPFDFSPTYEAAPDISRFLCGTPSILAIAALQSGVATFDGVSLAAIRQKSLALSDLFWQLMDEQCANFGFSCVSPREHALRASQLSFAHDAAYAIMQAIIERGVTGDFRQPDLLRFGFTPLYHRFVDMWDAVMIIRDVMLSNRWQEAKYQQRHTVT
jgi:kynureninase